MKCSVGKVVIDSMIKTVQQDDYCIQENLQRRSGFNITSSVGRNNSVNIYHNENNDKD